MKHKILYLPCFVYSISFAAILLLYQIGWSDLYPKLNGFLLFFLLFTIFLSLSFSFLQNRFLVIKTVDVELKKGFINRSMCFLGVGYLLEFLYEFSVPIISTFLIPSYSYDDFNGIPTFHVILGTFNIFLSILMYNFYLSDKNRNKLLLFVLTLIPYILVMNRGAFMIVFSAMIFLYLMKLKAIKLKTIFMPFAILGIVLYLFGVVGNIRQEQTKDDKEYLLRVAGATDNFIDSGVPNEFYWSYIYLISPMGNLQNLILEKEDTFELNNIGLFATTQLFPDFISKRLVSMFGYEDIVAKNDYANYYVTPLLNAPTFYYVSFFLIGSTGLIIMYFALTFSSLIYPYFVRKNSKYYLTSIASLNAIILLSTFNNMWYASGTILLWPIIFSAIDRVKIR